MQGSTKAAALAALLLPALLTPATGGEGEDRFLADGNRAKEYITFLASDELQGRQTCTEGFRRAADWVAARFEEWGLEPAGEDGTWFQAVPIRSFERNVGVPRLTVGDRAFEPDDGDFRIHSFSTPGAEARAEVVFVGYGISAADKGLDEYAGLNVEGKIVLAFTGSPHSAPEARGWFTRSSDEEAEPEAEDPWKEEAQTNAKVQTAYRRDALALLLYDPLSDEEGSQPRGRSSSRSGGDDVLSDRHFLTFTIEERVFRAILKSDPQESPSGFQRRVESTCRAIKGGEVHSCATGVEVGLKGYESVLKVSEEDGTSVARNVIAKIQGTDPRLKDQYVILGGHLDHVGMRDGYVRNGADDNASGSALTMEVARTLAQGGFKPKRTMVFCCWTGEEMGLLGSKHYAANPTDGVSLDRVVAYFNADMVGLGDAIRAPGALNFPGIWEVIQRDQDPEILEIVQPSTGGPGGSDHSAFIVEGIESLALMTTGGGGHPDFHQPEDDAAKIDPGILGRCAQFALQGAMNLALETEVDLLIENRKEIYQGVRMNIANFNPGLEDSIWEVVTMEEDGKAALHDRILSEALEMIREDASRQRASRRSRFGPAPEAGEPRGPSRPARSATRGLADLRAFAGDVDLLGLASEFYGFGRVDIRGDDGVWIAEGRLTDPGRAALRKMEEIGLVVHLQSPGEGLVDDFLSAAGKPFLITGDLVLDDSRAERIAAKEVLLGIDLDPGDVDGFIARLERAKELLGTRSPLVIHLTSTEGLDSAKVPLYLGLIEKGWAHKEICGSQRGEGGITGGNLQVIGAAPPRRYRY